MFRRKRPNCLITGTPGTGKSTLCERLAEENKDLTIVSVGELAEEKSLYESYDEEFECHVLDEDGLIKEMEPILESGAVDGGIIVDYHGCDLFPEDWFDAVFVLRSSNKALFDRLTDRAYSQKKIDSNIESEIFQTILDEAKEAFEDIPVTELESNHEEDLERNVEALLTWFRNWS